MKLEDLQQPFAMADIEWRIGRGGVKKMANPGPLYSLTLPIARLWID